jgi:nuclear transport factor 2 (NTF2) superfamily protein
LAYTPDSEWRNRGEFIKGRDEIRKVRSLRKSEEFEEM